MEPPAFVILVFSYEADFVTDRIEEDEGEFMCSRVRTPSICTHKRTDSVSYQMMLRLSVVPTSSPPEDAELRLQ